MANKGFAKILTIVIGAALLLLIVMFAFSGKSKHKNGPQFSEIFNISPLTDNLNYFNDVSQLESCGDKKELFNTMPLALDSFASIDPLGLLAPTAHVFPTPHLYFRINRQDPNNYESAVIKAPLYSPADVTVTRINLIEATNKSSVADDSAVHFSPCSDVKAYFDHVVDLVPNLQQAFNEARTDRCDEYTLTYKDGPINWKKCDKKVNVKISAGDLIGYAGGGQGQAVLDFAAFDQRITPNNYASPKRNFRKEWPYAVCPLDYFSQPISDQFKDKLGGISDDAQARGFVKSPTCGKVIQDIAGRAKGNWFAPNVDTSRGDDPPHLALAQGHINQSLQAFSNGDSVQKSGLSYGLYYFEPQNSGLINRDFAEVTPDGNVYCYETKNNYKNNELTTILIQLTNNETLKIQGMGMQGCGGGTWQMTNYSEFQR